MPPVTSDVLQGFFARIVPSYERVNHLITLGLDAVWRRRAARLAASAARRGDGAWADVCTGTGEMAALLCRLAPAGVRIHGVDFSEPMLAEARRKPEAARVEFHTANVDALPFPDGSLDLITLSFGTRNINASRDVLVRRFAGFRRALRPGGCFVNLETSQPALAPARAARDLYVRLAVASIGGRITGARPAYEYLARSMAAFYSAAELSDLLREAGFVDVQSRRLCLGAAAIHRATAPP